MHKLTLSVAPINAPGQAQQDTTGVTKPVTSISVSLPRNSGVNYAVTCLPPQQTEPGTYAAGNIEGARSKHCQAPRAV